VLLALPDASEDKDGCPVIVANSDQYLDGWHPSAFMDFIRRDDPDGAILTFHGSHPKWSFAEVETEGNRVVRVAEKDPISTRACTGVFYFKSVGLLRAALLNMMVSEKNKVLGEWYLAPVYNTLIANGCRIIEFPIPRMLGLGTPEDLQRFERLLEAGKVTV
jgi:dTDP-glucose pyrophosphorylase